MQPTGACNQFVARPKMQVIRIRQDDVGVQHLDLIKRETFNRCARAHGHERGCLHGAVRELENAAARATIGRGHSKRQISTHVGGPCGKPAYNGRA